MKRKLLILAILCLLVAALAISANAETVDSGTCGDNLTWTLDDAGTLTISGNGAMFNYYESHAPWYVNRSAIKQVEISSGITSIGYGAFSGCNPTFNTYDNAKYLGNANNPYLVLVKANSTEIASCTIHEDTKFIHSAAFSGCSSLTSVIIPDGITGIGSGAFTRCDSLVYNTYDNAKYIGNTNNPYVVLVKANSTEIVSCAIHEDTKVIHSSAFSRCINLASINIPDSVTNIGYDAFFYCSGLTSMTIGESVTIIDYSAFYDCSGLTGIWVDENNLNYSSDTYGVLFNKDKTRLIQCPGGYSGSYVIPESVTGIDDAAFCLCRSLTGVTIPDNVTDMGDFVFSGCSGLSNVTIGDGITSIGVYAFRDCKSLTGVTIPGSVTSIVGYPFSNCSSLTSITFEGDAPAFGNDEFGSDVFGELKVVAYYPANNATWTEDVMQDCGGDIDWVPYCDHSYETVVSAPTCTEAGYTTYTCTVCGDSYTEEIPAAGHKWSAWVRTKAPSCSAEGSQTRFCNCGERETQSVEKLPHSYNDGEQTKAPSCLETGVMIYTCTACGYSYTEEIPATGHSYEDSVCAVCGYAAQLVTGGTCGDDLTWYLDEAGKLTITGTGEMYDYSYDGDAPWFGSRKAIKAVVIEKGVTNIGWAAFNGCINLTAVTIPDSVTSIGGVAFFDCSSLRSVTIPDGVTNIDAEAFSGTGLTSVTIPDSVTTIDYGAFGGCVDLTNVTIGDGVTTIGAYAFGWCDNLTNVTMGESLTSIGDGAFSECISLTSMIIPDSVTTIGHYAFIGCQGMTSVTIGDSVNTIGMDAFTNCVNIDEIEFRGNAPEIYGAFTGVTAKAFYPADNATWTEDVMQDYGGDITWVAYAPEPEIVKFDFSGSTMTLGNELVLNFVYNKALLTGTDNYAKVTIAREDGDYTYEIPQSEWTAFNAALNQIPVKVFAKEMTDEVTVVICNAAGQEVSNPRTGSVVAYCNNLFEKSNVQKDKAMAVDMLNYGAAAQIQFNYREETLANAGLTDELKALATVVTDMQDASVKGPGCAGNTLTLEDKILLNFVYQNATIDKAAYATVSYVDHYGVAVNYNIEAADFLTFNSSMKMVQINTLVVADCRTMVSVELFDAKGNSLGISKNSVESYTARSGQELFKAILAFGDSAYAKFH